MFDRIAPRFARHDPLRQAGELMLGLRSGLDRKNCWTRPSAMICATMSSTRSVTRTPFSSLTKLTA